MGEEKELETMLRSRQETNRVGGLKGWLEDNFPELSFSLRRAKWYLEPRGWHSRRMIRNYKNLHAGERCFIIGNGPSLNKMDLHPLAGEITFSLNRGYLYYDRIGEPCTYLVSVNAYVMRQFAEEILALDNTRFLAWGCRRLFPIDDRIGFIAGPTRNDPPRFSTDVTRDIWGGATVTYVAMQLAYYMGFKQAILIGVDHRFATKGDPHTLVTSEGDDPNHFAPGYFGKGVKWQLPDLETSELAYTLARDAYAADGREILDATVDGKLTVFPKVHYEDLF